VLEGRPLAFSFVKVPNYAGFAVVALRGELDITDAQALSSWLVDIVSREPWVIVDLAELEFVDCGSCRLLAGARDLARRAGGDVLLAGPRGVVAQVLVLTGWAEVFSVFPVVELAAFSAALSALGGRLAATGAREPAAAEYRTRSSRNALRSTDHTAQH
jgi:anti-anti-sigma factor